VAIALVFVGTLLALVFAWLIAPEPGELARALVRSALLAAVALAATLTLGPGAWRASTPLAPAPRWLALAPLAGLLSFAVSVGYVRLVEHLAGTEPPPLAPDALPVLLLAWALLPALAEEWLCRGVLWTASLRALSPSATLLLTSALFAILHGLNGADVLEYPHRFAAGLVFGFLRLRSASLLPGMLAHACHNALAILTE